MNNIGAYRLAAKRQMKTCVGGEVRNWKKNITKRQKSRGATLNKPQPKHPTLYLFASERRVLIKTDAMGPRRDNGEK